MHFSPTADRCMGKINLPQDKFSLYKCSILGMPNLIDRVIDISNKQKKRPFAEYFRGRNLHYSAILFVLIIECIAFSTKTLRNGFEALKNGSRAVMEKKIKKSVKLLSILQ